MIPLKLSTLAPVSIFLAACVPATDRAGDAGAGYPPSVIASCDASQVNDSVGKTLTADLQDRLKSDAKAEIVRVALHDGAITMDYNSARLNIFIDSARKIVRINCG